MSVDSTGIQLQQATTKINMPVDARAGIRLHDVDETKQASQLKSVLNASTEHGAWVVSDQSGVRQDLLQTFGMQPVTAIFHDLHSKGNTCRYQID